ncbi:hypothetical protein DFH28DRAFT_1117909 [Melampsora americana]|nr:hypothetical protein DFH28DRAFT_1117909 [Melampsora americana]
MSNAAPKASTSTSDTSASRTSDRNSLVHPLPPLPASFTFNQSNGYHPLYPDGYPPPPHLYSWPAPFTYTHPPPMYQSPTSPYPSQSLVGSQPPLFPNKPRGSTTTAPPVQPSNSFHPYSWPIPFTYAHPPPPMYQIQTWPNPSQTPIGSQPPIRPNIPRGTSKMAPPAQPDSTDPSRNTSDTLVVAAELLTPTGNPTLQKLDCTAQAFGQESIEQHQELREQHQELRDQIECLQAERDDEWPPIGKIFYIFYPMFAETSQNLQSSTVQSLGAEPVRLMQSPRFGKQFVTLGCAVMYLNAVARYQGYTIAVKSHKEKARIYYRCGLGQPVKSVAKVRKRLRKMTGCQFQISLNYHRKVDRWIVQQDLKNPSTHQHNHPPFDEPHNFSKNQQFSEDILRQIDIHTSAGCRAGQIRNLIKFPPGSDPLVRNIHNARY